MDGAHHHQSQYDTANRRRGQTVHTPIVDQSGQEHSRMLASASRERMGPPETTTAHYAPGYQYSYTGQYDPHHFAHSQQLPDMQIQQYNQAYLQETARPQHYVPASQAQHFAGYGSSSLTQHDGQSLYSGMPSYQQQRHSAAIEVLAGQFTNVPPFLHPDASTITSSDSGSHFVPSGPDQSSYNSTALPTPQLQPAFTPLGSEFAVMEHVPSQTAADSARQEAVHEGQRQYEENLRSTYGAIRAGRVKDAVEPLMRATRWLLGSVRVLGLHHDEESKHEERIQLWQTFNHAWEALGQKQKNILLEARRSRRAPAQMLDSSTMKSMVDELVGLTDSIEKYGLVDYEMGVWEEQIVSIFTQCLDLLPNARTPSDMEASNRRP